MADKVVLDSGRAGLQVGVICFGGNLDKAWWIADTKAKGYEVVDKGDYAEIYKA
jgi:hypothetical protein